MARRDPEGAPYKVSRADLRDRYGSRVISGSAPQSALDSTPSGMIARAQQAGGLTEQEAKNYQKREFYKKFETDQVQPQPVQSAVLTPVQGQQKGMFSGGVASPEDVSTLVDQGAIGTVRTPYGTVTLPQTMPATDMAEYLPSSGTPLSGFALTKPKPAYLGSVLKSTSRWNKSIYG